MSFRSSFLCVLFWLGGVLACEAVSNQWSSAVTPGYWSVAYAHGRYVAVGANGFASVSDDGYQWQHVAIGTTQTLFSVASGNGVFVATGRVGFGAVGLFTSADGFNWTSTYQLSNALIHGVDFVEGEFFATGSFGFSSLTNLMLHSADGYSWVPSWSPVMVPRSGSHNAVAFGNGLYVAVGYSILTSSNGTNWSRPLGSPILPLQSVCFGNGRFVAVGGDFSASGAAAPNRVTTMSTDGYAWQTSSFGPGVFLGVIFAQNKFVAVGDNGLLCTSTDGLSWIQIPHTLGLNLARLLYVNGRFLAVGNGFGNYDNASVPYGGLVALTLDLTNWTTITTSARLPLSAATYGNGKVMSSSSDPSLPYFLWTQDGTRWQSKQLPGAGPVLGLNYFAGRFLASLSDGSIVSSADGVDWTTNPHPAVATSLRAIASSSNVCLLAGSSPGLLRTTDGTNFSASTEGGFNYLLYDGQRFLGGGKGLTGTSVDGITWNYARITNQFGPPINIVGGYGVSAAYGNGTYVSVGLNYPYSLSSIWASADAVHWTNQIPATPQNLNSVIFSGGQFIAVGDGGTIVSSPDGTNWTSVPSGTTAALAAIVVGNASLFVFGTNGTILRSTPTATPGKLSFTSFSPATGVALSLIGSNGFDYAIEARTNLVRGDWTTLQLLKASTNPLPWNVQSGTNDAQKFFRARLLP